jgi:hypothetical protein
MEENNPKQNGLIIYWKTPRGKSTKEIEKKRVLRHSGDLSADLYGMETIKKNKIFTGLCSI